MQSALAPPLPVAFPPRSALPGEVAQLVEHTTENRGVAGSNPALATAEWQEGLLNCPDGWTDGQGLLGPGKTELTRERIALSPGAQQPVDFLPTIWGAIRPIQQPTFFAAGIVEGKR
jgi:hypothetical protein